jgi:hypothetical protein
MIYILKGNKGQRASHWRDIQSRVRTHEGELLSGSKGREYQRRWSKKMLGRDLSAGKVADEIMVEKYEKTGK